VAGDIRSEEHCRSLVERAFDEFGKLDLLVNNAAFQMGQQSIEDITSEQFDRTFKTNVDAMARTARLSGQPSR
jgi:NAD(P)-dependent dehydrogenase (short-subunit alcohol dehydrogenase family)